MHCLIAAILVAGLSQGPATQEIVCPGTYGGHLQGLATDNEQNIYWSFTVALVKTNRSGELLKTVSAPSHQGDLTWVDGKVYVAVNLGKFNQEPGQADSWVYIYDDQDLTLLEKKAVPELVHGAGGMAFHEGKFIVVGGLPVGYSENYAYEYDRDFNFVKRHVIQSGYTKMGIQTTCWFDGAWWFGCYEDDKGLLKTDEHFTLLGRFNPNYSVGIAPWTDGNCLRGVNHPQENKQHSASAVVDAPGKTTETAEK
ncbi:MAG TPA: hypothetical protein PLD73_03210 [Candidatus Hydrogenedentes bacterium]|jgi:hypothetical protein|nr:hypothetical protein [Candidatus Hydrogenedentota bacterium]HPK00114.1 hypothetical protein [Candidatus Hydrogenedentota bacterium]